MMPSRTTLIVRDFKLARDERASLVKDVSASGKCSESIPEHFTNEDFIAV